ncbi:hypothetical protein [Paenibacillus elgii]|uniref:hypothetical protein n=1 Tax=Paenibacillus elgii TaxID=189691 RepID=UPI0002F9889B|nr:hypothetical protein [Paenibacillus elgii]
MREESKIIISKTTIVKWGSREKQYYVNLGYKFTKTGDLFEVKIDHLKFNSHAKILVKCDYCGELLRKTYSKVTFGREVVPKDACKFCRFIKAKEINYIKYGVDNTSKLKENRIKISSSLKTPFETVVKLFNEKNLTVSCDEFYWKTHDKLKYFCNIHPNEGIQEITLRGIKENTGCRACWLDRISGKNSVHWRGGISELILYIRSRTLNEWKKKSLDVYSFKCAITNEYGNLEVHHLYPFHKIFRESHEELKIPIKLKLNDYTDKEVQDIKQLILQKHNALLGVPLKKEIHSLFHQVYGYDVTPEQFYLFKQNYENNLYDYLVVNNKYI